MDIVATFSLCFDAGFNPAFLQSVENMVPFISPVADNPAIKIGSFIVL